MPWTRCAVNVYTNMLINAAEIECGLIGVGQHKSASKSIALTHLWMEMQAIRQTSLFWPKSARAWFVMVIRTHAKTHFFIFTLLSLLISQYGKQANDFYNSIVVFLSLRPWCVFLRRETRVRRSRWRCWTVTRWHKWKISCWMRCTKGSRTHRDHKLMIWTSVRAQRISHRCFIHTHMQYLKALAVVSVINSL